jgi:hypothetical protein
LDSWMFALFSASAFWAAGLFLPVKVESSAYWARMSTTAGFVPGETLTCKEEDVVAR